MFRKFKGADNSCYIFVRIYYVTLIKYKLVAASNLLESIHIINHSEYTTLNMQPLRGDAILENVYIA